MEKSNRNYVIVGAFVFAMLVGLVATMAILMGRTGATDRYYATFRNIAGVKLGTAVFYDGFVVGQVDGVVLETMADDSRRFRVDFIVKRGFPIPEDSVAEIILPGLLAAVAVNIQTGNSKTFIEPGDEIEGKDAVNVVQQAVNAGEAMAMIAKEVTAVAKRFQPILETIDKTVEQAGSVLTSETAAIAADMRALLVSLNETASQVNVLFKPENRRKLEDLIGNLEKASVNMTSMSARLDKLSASLNSTVDDVRGDVDRSAANLRYVTESVARDIDTINQDLAGAARNMNEFSRQLRHNPGLLLGGAPPEDAALRE